MPLVFQVAKLFGAYPVEPTQWSLPDAAARSGSTYRSVGEIRARGLRRVSYDASEDSRLITASTERCEQAEDLIVIWNSIRPSGIVAAILHTTSCQCSICQAPMFASSNEEIEFARTFHPGPTPHSVLTHGGEVVDSLNGHAQARPQLAARC